MKTSLALVALIASSLSGFAAQGPPDGPRMSARRVTTMATVLSLSSSQQTQVTKIYSDAQTAAKTVHANMRTARTSLDAAVKKNDLGAIESLSAQIGTMEGQLLSINSKAEASVYGTLTPEQQAKADVLHIGRGGMGGPGGPGGMSRRPPQN